MSTYGDRLRGAAAAAPDRLCLCGHGDWAHNERAHGDDAYRVSVFPCAECACSSFTDEGTA